MAAQPKTQQAKALLARVLTDDQMLDMVASGWTLERIAGHVETLTGTKLSKYYICKALQATGDRYAEAKRLQAQMHAERVAAIAEEVEQGKLDPASARVASDNRKWVASKLDPATYSERAQIDVAVTDVTALHLAQLRDRLKTVATQ